MSRITKFVLLGAGVALTLVATASGEAQRARRVSSGDALLIRSAMTAAPPSVARGAAVVAMDARGRMRTVRRGSNGFTCLAVNPATPGPDPM
jgi:hypothetical protein